jgi:transcriptional regulator with XRE-family HTH domain
MSSHGLNLESINSVHMDGNDTFMGSPHNVVVTESSPPNWYLQEWAAHEGKRQSDLVADLGWLKNHAHRIWHGKQPYRRDIVNQLAEWLKIEPFELLMPPERAVRLRQLEDVAFAIAAERPRTFRHEKPDAQGDK